MKIILFLKNNLLKYLTIFLFIILIIFQVRKSYTTGVGYDDGYNASVAKNIALGYGYSTTYPEKRLFNPEITTGPFLILPTSGFIYFLGNKYWVPNLSASIIIILLLLLNFCVLQRLLYYKSNIWKLSFLILLFMLLFNLPGHWFQLVGETPSSLLVSLGIMLLYLGIKNMDYKYFIFTGIFWGFALLTKFITLLSVITIIITMLISKSILNKSFFKKSPSPIILILILSYATPIFLFETYKLIALNGNISYYQKITSEEVIFFKSNSASGFNILKDISRIQCMKNKFIENFIYLVEHLFSNSIWKIIVFSIIIVIIIFYSVKYQSREPNLNNLSIFFLLTFSLHFLWWILLGTKDIRFLLPAIIYLCFYVGIVITIISENKKIYSLLILLSFIILTNKINYFHQEFFSLNFNKDPRLIALLETKKFIKENITSEKYTLVGMGWWVCRDLEYLLPDVGNFRDCLLLNNKRYKNILLVRSDVWDNSDKKVENFVKECEKHILFYSRPFTISLCSPTALKILTQ